MRIGILGTGAYGMALASVFEYNKCNIMMWTNSKEEEKLLLSERKSNKIDYEIPSSIVITTDLKEVVSNSDIIVIAVPAKFVNSVCLQFKDYCKNGQIICIASKGIEQDSCMFLYDIVRNSIESNDIAVISGGTFAVDIVRRVPVGLSLATESETASELIMNAMENDYVKLRPTKDIIGTEICGAIKNVIAIASGMIDGMGYPESTSTMFITESLNDIKELIAALGGDSKSILSFAGFGDLLLTCTSVKSRNYTLGKLIGENRPREEIDKYIDSTTIEGLYTLTSIKKLLNDKKIKMPIINLIYDIIVDKKEPHTLVKFLVEKQ